MTKVFVIDDSEIEVAILHNALTNAGFDVVPVSNEDDVVSRAIIEKPDIVILDLFMPNRDGFTVCRLLKTDERTHDIPIIFLTSSTDYKDVVQSMHFGVIDYISKPLCMHEMVNKLQLHTLAQSLRKDWCQFADTARSLLSKYPARHETTQ